MTGILDTAVSGLLTAQQQLATTGHNIANASTPGYSRQRVETVAQRPDNLSGIGIGNGVLVSSIERYHDQFITSELRHVQSEQSRLDTLHTLAALVDDVLADPEGGITPALQDFFSAVQDIADAPASADARIALIYQADALSQRFQYFDRRFADQDQQVSERTREIVNDINGFVRSIDNVNKEIVAARANGLKTTPPDLLDHRDQLLADMSALIDIDVIENANNTVDIFAPQGQNLLSQHTVSQLRTVRDPANPTRERIVYDGIPSNIDITDTLSGGELGGLLDFRREMLDGVRNQLGLVAIGIAEAFNEQHRQGMTLEGQLGTDFFQMSQPNTTPHSNNTGSATVAAAITDVSALTTQNYRATFDGTNWTVSSLDQSSTVSGTGPNLTIDGLTIQTTGTAAAGDHFLIQPTLGGAQSFTSVISRTEDIAAASPIRTAAHPNNQGNAIVNTGAVIDVNHPNLLDSVQVQFNDPATSFDLIDPSTGAVLLANQAYTSNSPIDFNGWRIEISGTPQMGDRFTIEANVNGSSDNRNMLALAELQGRNTLLSGTANFQEVYSAMVADVGSQTRYAEINKEAQTSLYTTLEARRENFAGVNLDEEAADLLRFQQAYEASARVIQTANTIFQSLLNAF